MKLLWPLMLCSCCLTTLFLLSNGQESRESTPRPNSIGHFMKLIQNPIRNSFTSANGFIGRRINDIYRGINATRSQTYRMFMRLYNKTYLAEELPRRMSLFFERRKQIQQSIRDFMEGRSTYVLKENEFTDLDDSELGKLSGVILPKGSPEPTVSGTATRRANMSVGASAASKDWRTSGCIGEPLHQGSCGACYAFATVSVVESMRCIRQVRPSYILSQQQIIDCATPQTGWPWINGCKGGYPMDVLRYYQQSDVAARARCYPYASRQQSGCRLKSMQTSSRQECSISPSADVGLRLQPLEVHTEAEILQHVASVGPVVTLLEATPSLYSYSRGVFDDPTCSRKMHAANEHAVVIVGYGSERGLDYWLVKNSWGPGWGEGGYAKVRRGVNACSIGHWGWMVK